jgi:hypothetical protein
VGSTRAPATEARRRPTADDPEIAEKLRALGYVAGGR